MHAVRDRVDGRRAARARTKWPRPQIVLRLHVRTRDKIFVVQPYNPRKFSTSKISGYTVYFRDHVAANGNERDATPHLINPH